MKDVTDLRQYMVAIMKRENRTWTRRDHELLWGERTNQMFGSLLLGLERLVSMGVLCASHGSMWEDMLEAWKWSDGL